MILRLLYEHTLGPDQPLWVNNGSNLTVFGLIPSTIALYWHHTCSNGKCPRLAHHPVAGTGFRTCHKHSTIEVHDRLHSEHALKHPLHHELLNRRKP